MRCARGLGLGVGLALAAVAGGADAAPPVLLRLANLTTAPESARIGFAFTLDGPPLVDELPAGALTTLLPGPPAGLSLQELWVLPRGLTLPKSLPEPLAVPLPVEGAGPAPPLPFFTVFLIDRKSPRPGASGERVRQLITGTAPPPAADGAQLRVLNLVGSAELDVCAQDDSVLTRAVPAWGLSRAPQWFAPAPQAPAPQAPAPQPHAPGHAGSAAFMDVRVATEPPCQGEVLSAVPRPERGAFTIALLPAAPATPTAAPPPDLAAQAALPALRALILDEASLAPEHLVPLPVRPPSRPSSAAKSPPKSAQTSVR